MSALSDLAEAPLVDLSDAALWQAPAQAMAAAREAAPLARSRRGEPVVLRYAATERLLADPRMRTTGATLLEGIGIRDGPLAEWWRLVMFNTNPPEHGRLRKLVSHGFTARRVEALRPRIRSRVDALLDALLGAGDVDFEAGLADPLPIQVTCELLGVPVSLQQEVSRLTVTLGSVFATRVDDALRSECEGALQSLRALLAELFEQRRREPADDLLSALLLAEDEGVRLTPLEREALAINLLFAGHDTTRGLLSIGIAEWLQHPQAVAAVRDDPTLVAGSVEEMLRLAPPVLGSLRAPGEAIAFGDDTSIELAAGAPVHFLFPAANRDPRAFFEPDRFDPRRRGPRPLTFGLGAHFCLGAGLARVEAQETLAALVARSARVELLEAPRLVPYATIRRLAGGLRLALTPR